MGIKRITLKTFQKSEIMSIDQIELYFGDERRLPLIDAEIIKNSFNYVRKQKREYWSPYSPSMDLEIMLPKGHEFETNVPLSADELPAASIEPSWSPEIPALAETFREAQRQLDTRPTFVEAYVVTCTRNERGRDPDRLDEALGYTHVRDDVFVTMLRLSALDDEEIKIEEGNLRDRVERGELTEDDVRDFDVLVEHAARATGNTFTVMLYDTLVQSLAKKEPSEP